ncbi:hypothetical protein RDV78_04640 [Bacillota bacterium LX-D]|nr:hypothetical protein [Bacillota bacterium LX-D]
MRNNKFKMAFALYKKDLHELLPEIILVAVLAIMIMLGLTIWGIGPVVILPLVILCGLAYFLPVLDSFKMLFKEWSTNAIYLVLSLPVSGNMVFGVKLLALLTQFIIGILITGVTCFITLLFGMAETDTSWAQIWGIFGTDFNVYLKLSLLLFLLTVAVLTFLICLSFFSSILGKVIKKYSGVVTFASFIIFWNLAGKVINYIFSFMGNSPNMHLDLANLPVQNNLLLPLGEIALVYFLTALVFFIAATQVYQRKTEL